MSLSHKGAQHLAGQANPQTELLLYGNSTPGPLLVGRKSDMLEVEFINRLEMASTIHWHGIRNLNEMDGVPELTQPNVEPGERFHYRFALKDAAHSGIMSIIWHGSRLPEVCMAL